MKRTARTVLMVLLAVVFAGSAAMMIRQSIQYQEGEEMYAEAESLVELPDLSRLPQPAPEQTPQEETPEETPQAETPVYVDPYAEALREMDFTALREVNQDVLGWILIPNTVLSYPLVQGEDNAYYLDHTWKKTRSAVGAIFMECSNSRDLSDFNTIVYGHRMNNGSMFASLKNYKKQSYWQAHPDVYITDDSGSHRYAVFAAYEVSTAGDTYRVRFSSEQSRQDFLDYCLEQSVIDTGVVPTVHDRVLTLSTCTGRGHATRWVIQAVEKGAAPAEPAETAPEEPVPPQPDLPAEPAPDALPDETLPPENAAEGAAPDLPPETEEAPSPETEVEQ